MTVSNWQSHTNVKISRPEVILIKVLNSVHNRIKDVFIELGIFPEIMLSGYISLSSWSSNIIWPFTESF